MNGPGYDKAMPTCVIIAAGLFSGENDRCGYFRNARRTLCRIRQLRPEGQALGFCITRALMCTCCH